MITIWFNPFLIYSSLSVFYTKQCTDTINRNYQKLKSLGVGVGFGYGRKMFQVAPDANKLAKYGWIMALKRSFNRILQPDYPYRKIRNLGLRSNYQPNLKYKIGLGFLDKVLRVVRSLNFGPKPFLTSMSERVGSEIERHRRLIFLNSLFSL